MRAQALWRLLHRLLGLSAGLVLAVMGLTGSVLSFEEELLSVLNPGLVRVTDTAAPALTPPQLFAAAQAAHPQRRVSLLMLEANEVSSARVTVAPLEGDGRGDTQFVHPETGLLLGSAQGEDTLHVIEEIHRRLAAGEVGKAITGAAALILAGLLLSGLYQRWPTLRAGAWHQGMTFNLRLRRRAFLSGLHQTLGTWLLLPLLLSVLTGLYWSYDWYRDSLYRLSGVPVPQPWVRSVDSRNIDHSPPAIDLDAVWAVYLAAVPAGYQRVTLSLPQRAGQPVQLLYLDAAPAHDRAFSLMDVDPQTGAVLKHQPYAERTRGVQFLTAMFPLHSGSYFGLPGRIVMALSSLMLPVFFVTGWIMYRQRRRMQHEQQVRRWNTLSSLREHKVRRGGGPYGE